MELGFHIMERRLDRVENAKQFLLNNPELKDEIDKKVRAHYGIGEEADTAEAEDTKAKSKKKTGEKEAEEVNV